MKKYLIIFTALLCLLCSCSQKEELTYDNFVGRWELTALYLNGGTGNMLSMAQLFEPCIKGSTLEFTDHQTFELLSDCGWMADSGAYTLEGEIIKAEGEQGTQYFQFANGQLSITISHESYSFQMCFEKQKYKSEYIISVQLLDQNSNNIAAPADYDTIYHVAHQGDIDIKAATIPDYQLTGDSVVSLKQVTYDQEVTFTYLLTTK